MKLLETSNVNELKTIEQSIQSFKPTDLMDLATFLTEIDGIKCTENLCIIGTTNYCDRIDDALKRDFRFTPFNVGLFDKDLTEQLIRHLYYLDNDYYLGVDQNINISPSKVSYLCLKYDSAEEVVRTINQMIKY